jgi:hypothetical protein
VDLILLKELHMAGLGGVEQPDTTLEEAGVGIQVAVAVDCKRAVVPTHKQEEVEVHMRL